MNDQNQTPLVERQIGYARRSFSSQTIVEFAIVLPLLLVLFLGIIEFARAFQSYLTITNSARFGVRYAVTGEYNPAYCVDGPDDGSEACGGDDKSIEEDAARIPSIHDEVLRVTNGILLDAGAVKTQPEYFHQVVCSSRATFSYDRTNDQCIPGEDAGNPEDGPTRVMVAITYNHPAIVPLINVLWPFVQMHAERTGILESFRVARVVGLPPLILVPTFTSTNTSTPTDTPVPSDTPTPTPTNTPTDTPTATPTNTPTPTATPDCSFLKINPGMNFFFKQTDIDIPLENISPNYLITVYNIDTTWNGGWHDEGSSLPTSQYFDKYTWTGGSYSPAHVSLSAGGIHMNHNISANIAAATKNTISEVFHENFTNYWLYYHLADFGITLNYTVGSLDCSVPLVGRYGPVIDAIMPSGPVSGSFTIQALPWDPDPDGSIERVNFEVDDSLGNVVYQVNRNSSPFCINGGNPCKNITLPGTWPNGVAIINGTYTVYIQARDHDAQLGGAYTMPEQQFSRIKRTLVIGMAPSPTPTNSLTPTITFTPSITPTPSKTPVPSRTPTASNTPLATATKIPSSTPLPTNTPLPPKPTDTNTAKPPAATKTDTPIPPPTKTNTPVTPQPSKTNTPPPAPSRTPTRTPTRTPCPGGGYDC
jgi:hypothetical protein